eukprot:gnl/Spiro4/2228_TR1073_c0_g1_i1.p1 gnl/Spiro4/2228_TR1073_c0_g1~~gnl/Spiro4/2228_TR1073_c0_g1_i1.p1  ORF type:complete len:643 (-),score=111.67 gnl/Spiro4/2228_TR1073_c0_g1_i1:10-1938(-)
MNRAEARKLAWLKQKQRTTQLPVHKKDRRVQDVIYLFIFVAFWIGMFVVMVRAFDLGDPRRLSFGFDAFGNLCNTLNSTSTIGATYPGSTLSFPKLYFVVPNDTTTAICIAACPATATALPNGLSDAVNVLSFPSFYASSLASTSVTSWFTVTGATYATTDVFNVCVASSPTSADITITYADGSRLALQRLLGDIEVSYVPAIGGVVFALAVGFGFLLLLLLFPKIVFIVAAGLSAASTAAFGGWLLAVGVQMQSYNTLPGIASVVPQMTSRYSMSLLIIAFGAIFCALAVGLIFTTIYVVPRLELATMMADASRRIIMDTQWGLLVAPLLMSLVQISVSCYGVAVSLSVGTVGEVNNGVFQPIASLRNLQLYHLAGIILFFSTSVAFMRVLVSGVVGFWFYNNYPPHTEKDEVNPVDEDASLRLATVALTKHRAQYVFVRSLYFAFQSLGSCLLGSILLGLIRSYRHVVRLGCLLMAAPYKRHDVHSIYTPVHDFDSDAVPLDPDSASGLRSHRSSHQHLPKVTHAVVPPESCCCHCCVECCNSCLLCWERFFLFLCKTAWVQVAVRNYSFCQGARHAFNLQHINRALMPPLSSAVDACVTLIKMMIVSWSGLLTLGLVLSQGSANAVSTPFYPVPPPSNI